MPRNVVVPYAREFEVPLAQAYAWLTDYSDDDPQRAAGAILRERRVVERSPDLVVLEGATEVLGRRFRGRAEVRLMPPDRWEARFSNGSVYSYRLQPSLGGCRLDVEYRVKTRRLGTWLGLRLARRRVRREIHRMWEGFAASMRADLASAGNA